ncbi:hypothetical protein TNCV_708361 [Trichonephila clavipes]|nr:hypothetical protein TNCV_708361 [Trichonephila clavipes]
MRTRAYWVHPSIRDHRELRCMSRCPDQVVSLKRDPQCLSPQMPHQVYSRAQQVELCTGWTFNTRRSRRYRCRSRRWRDNSDMGNVVLEYTGSLDICGYNSEQRSLSQHRCCSCSLVYGCESSL